MEKKSIKNLPVLRILFRVIQGAFIGLGAVLPGISGGVLCVVFGIYKPIMELLSHPIQKFKTHVPKLLPVIIGIGIGFLGIANLLSFFLEKYPAPSVCLFVGLIVGMMPSLFREAGEQGRSKGSYDRHGGCIRLAACIAIFFYSDCSQFCVVFVLRFLSCAKRNRPRHELLYSADAFGALHAFCRRYWAFKYGCFNSWRNRRLSHCDFVSEGR